MDIENEIAWGRGEGGALGGGEREGRGRGEGGEREGAVSLCANLVMGLTTGTRIQKPFRSCSSFYR